MAKSKKFRSVMPPYSPEDCEVSHVQPYQALKEYICPFCNGTIPKGLGHEVAVPKENPEDRRHFHSGCWRTYTN